MAKPTSLAAQLSRQDAEANRAASKEDLEVSSRPTVEGKVWVRLMRPHYDANNVMHLAGIALLDADAVPESAKRLSQADAEAEQAEED